MESLDLEDVSEREEGEIVEDELEDVSDCSLSAGSPLNPGKSVSPPEILNGVCLSKASNHVVCDKPLKQQGTKWRQISLKKQNSQNGVLKKHHSKSRKPPIIEILSDSDDEMTDPRYAKQLRDALRRESSEVSPNNSLKTRLKLFIDNSSEDETNLNALRDHALLSTLKPLQSGDVQLHTESNKALELSPSETLDCIDPELQELRLEALKSVIIKNHERRKRKATPIPDNTGCDNYSAEVTNDINKENDQTFINSKKMKIEEDDVSLADSDLSSNNIDTKTSTENTDILEEDADILRAVLLASLSKNLATKPNDLEVKVPFEPPKVVVKPLIIHLNTDSDSDTESPENSPKNSLKNTVSEFLKRQRAQVEANVKKKSNITHVVNVSKRNDQLNKSVMKLLPRSQQLEYHRLKQQLLNAHKRVKTRRNSHRSLHNNKKELNHMTNSTKKSPIHKTDTPFTNNNHILVNNKVSEDNPKKKSDSAIGHLQNTLDDLQITKNGRLQMKGKYRSLGPLLNKINKASFERQENEILIKKLLQEIQIARTKLANSHQSFTNLVRQLVKEKHAIDDGAPSFSVPVIAHPVLNEEAPKIEQKGAEPINVAEEMACVENTCLQEPEEELLTDPNDITKIFVKQFIDEVSVPKYKSPLNYRDVATDPVTIICPHDLLGVCKDKECPYMHYS